MLEFYDIMSIIKVMKLKAVTVKMDSGRFGCKYGE